jgi:hypothetical protein
VGLGSPLNAVASPRRFVTHGLPVGLIPKEHHVAAVRDDVVDQACGHDPTVTLALCAERVSGEEGCTCLAPVVVISARRR